MKKSKIYWHSTRDAFPPFKKEVLVSDGKCISIGLLMGIRAHDEVRELQWDAMHGISDKQSVKWWANLPDPSKLDT